MVYPPRTFAYRLSDISDRGVRVWAYKRKRKRVVPQNVKVVLYGRLDYKLHKHPIVIEVAQTIVVPKRNIEYHIKKYTDKLHDLISNYVRGQIPSHYITVGVDQKAGTKSKPCEGKYDAKISHNLKSFESIDLEHPPKRGISSKKAENDLDKQLKLSVS